jgi:uncharacterized protein
MITLKKITLAFSLIGLSAFCNAIEVGGTLPNFTVPSKGELVLNGEKISHKPWSTSQIALGSPALIFHTAARMSSDGIIAPLKKRLNAREFEPGSFQSISIINLNDALWGTSGLISSELSKNKREHPEAILVADEKGAGIKAWTLSTGTVSFILVDDEGKIRYIKEGKLSAADIDTIMTLLDEEIAKSNS